MGRVDEAQYRAAEAEMFETYGVEPTIHRVSLTRPSTTVRVLEIGEGPPVLCIHGSPNSAATWVPLAAAAPDFRWLLLERPGAGLSDRTAWTDHPADVLALLDGVLDQLGVDCVDVIGSSFGALYAWRLALGAPSRTGRLVLMGCPGGVSLAPMPPIFRLLSAPLLPSLLKLGFKTDLESTRGMWREIGHGPTIDRGGLPEVLFTWYSALLTHTHTMEGVVDEVRAIATPFGYKAPITGADLAKITAPTLYLWGDEDNFASPADAERLAAATPGAALERFAGFGHLPWVDDPDQIAARVRAFLTPVSVTA